MRHRILVTCAVISTVFYTSLQHQTFAHHPASSSGGTGSGPINTIPAETLPKGDFNAGLSVHYTNFDSFSDNELETLAGKHIHAHSADWNTTAFLNLAYGIASDLSVSISAPYSWTDNLREGHHSHAGGAAVNEAESKGDVDGFGDMSALFTLKVLSLGNGLRGAALFGFKAPTGQTHESYEGERLDAEHQPGSGSWDALMGAALSGKAGSVALDSNVLYTLVTEGAQKTDLGDRVTYNVAASYRLPDDAMGGRWDLALELNGEWLDYQKTDGRHDKDTGGNVVFLSPGIRYAPDNSWSFSLSAGLPVIKNVESSHAEPEFRLMTGISRSF